MDILYKFYVGRLRLLRFSDVKENHGPRSSRRSSSVVYTNVCGLHKNFSDLSLIASCGDVSLFSSRRHISDLMVPSLGRPMRWLRGQVDRFRGLAVYVSEGFSAYRQRCYEYGCYGHSSRNL